MKKLLWITDPWNTLDKNDTTLRLLRESIKNGFISVWADINTLSLLNGKLNLNCYQIKLREQNNHFTYELEEREFKLDCFSYIFFRPDAPVDLSYIHKLQVLLAITSKNKKCKVVNNPIINLCYTSKMASALLGKHSPKTIISSNKGSLLRFGVSMKKTVVKPLNACQSQGIRLLSWTNEQEIDIAIGILQDVTSGFTSPIVLQEFLDIFIYGEIRVWYVKGNILCVIKKVLTTDDFRMDLDRKDKLVPYCLTTNEKEVALLIGKLFKKHGVDMVAVDFINNKVTDINFESPGLLVEIENIYKQNFAKIILEEIISF